MWSIGWKERKVPDAPEVYYAPGESDLNEHEVLLCGFLVAGKGFDTKTGMLQWARAVVGEETAANEQRNHWKPQGGASGGWKMVSGVSSLFSPMAAAVGSTWEEWELQRIGIAIQMWSGPGARDNLRARHLKRWLSEKPKGWRADKKTALKNAPPRWRTWSIVKVARLLLDHGDELREKLSFDEEPDFIMETGERILMMEKRNGQLEEQLRAAKRTAEKTAEALRKSNERKREGREERLKANSAKVQKRIEVALERMKRKAEEQTVADKKELDAAKAAAVEGQRERVEQLETQVSVARKRARTVEGKAADAVRNIERAQGAEHELEASKARVDEIIQYYGAASDAKQKGQELQKRFNSMPQFQLVRPKGTGRGAKTLEPEHRILIWELLSLGTPVAIIGKVIVAVVLRTAPWMEPVEPTPELLREVRFELQIAEECMAARRVGEAIRVRQLGLDQTTKFHVPSMVSSVLIDPPGDKPPEVVILRAAYGVGGATSKHEAASVEEKCFVRLRDDLRGWQKKCEQMFPQHIWTGPDPERCGLHRLGGGGCFISDTCTTARCTVSILIEMVKQQVMQKCDPATWAAFSEEQKEAAVRCHATHCWQHIRNIFLAPMSAAMSQLLKHKLGDELDAFTAQERVHTDMGSLLRADYKEFHRGGRYYKGAGIEFWEDVRINHPSAFLVPFERADGGRQDLDFDAAIPMYINRKYIIDFLYPRVTSKNHSNILESSIFVTHAKLEYVAFIRALAIVDLRIALPLHWIAGNGPKLKEWSPFSMGPVLSRIEAVFERGSRNGDVLLCDRSLDIFEPLIDTQPEFKLYIEWLYTKKTATAADGTTKYFLYKEVWDELMHPQDEDNADTRELTIEYLQAACADGLTKLHDRRTVLPQYLESQDGDLVLSKQAQAHADTMGCELSNDKFSESVFGTFDRMLKRNEGASREAAAALAHAMRHKSFSTGTDHVKRRKSQSDRRKPLPPPPPGIGYHTRLPRPEQLALVEYCRTSVRARRKVAAADNAEHNTYVRAKVRTTRQEERDALILEFGYGLSFFERWQVRGVRSAGELGRELRSISSQHPGDERAAYQEKLNFLREQIEMRTRGLRWTEFQTKYSSSLDENVGTVEQLTGHVKELIEEERERRDAGTQPVGSNSNLSVNSISL